MSKDYCYGKSKCITINNTSRSSYPTAHHNSKGGSTHSGGGSSSIASSDSKSSVVIPQPDIIFEGVNFKDISGWAIPTDREIAMGINPHFKYTAEDTYECKKAKLQFNLAVDYMLNSSTEPLDFGHFCEIFALKKKFEESMSHIIRHCVIKHPHPDKATIPFDDPRNPYCKVQ